MTSLHAVRLVRAVCWLLSQKGECYMYSVWFADTCFLTDIPTYEMSARIVCRLEELFGVTARIESD